MKVTVKDYLNVRVGKPSVNAPCYQYIAPGSEIEIDGNEYLGDKYDGIDTWVKDLVGNYYWSGGINRRIPVPYPNWITDFGIDEIWKSSTGSQVSVILLDSGIDERTPDIKDVQIEKISVVGDQGTDTYGHGSLMASIIAGNGSNIYGVAPQVKIYSIKITKDSKLAARELVEGLLQADRLIAETRNSSGHVPFIVNCSLAYYPLDRREANFIMEGISRLLAYQNVLVCAAVGNDFWSDLSKAPLPASIGDVISVDGMMKLNGSYVRLLSSNYWPGITLTAPADFPVESFTQQFSRKLEPQGSSHACAFTTGIMALFMAKAINLSKPFNHQIAKAAITKSTYVIYTGQKSSNFLYKENLVKTFIQP
jgi:subtilisin family serine protease